MDYSNIYGISTHALVETLPLITASIDRIVHAVNERWSPGDKGSLWKSGAELTITRYSCNDESLR